jgi:hypothetical protein
MLRLHLLAGSALLAGILLAVAGPAAGEIYKWTDETGTVHYGDRPTGADSEVRLDVTSERTNPERIQQIVQARSDARSERQKAEAARAANEPSPEELRAEAQQRAEKCTEYKERLQKFVTSRRLYRHDENGERVYLDEEQTLATRARVQEKVEEYCSP